MKIQVTAIQEEEMKIIYPEQKIRSLASDLIMA